jgi:hypothetical protein
MRARVLRHSRVEPERQRFGWSSQREPMLAGMMRPHLTQVFIIYAGRFGTFVDTGTDLLPAPVGPGILAIRPSSLSVI